MLTQSYTGATFRHGEQRARGRGRGNDALSDVDGERGELVIGGYQVDELAQHATFEETTWLLWHGRLPLPHPS